MNELPPNQRPNWKRNGLIGFVVSMAFLLLSFTINDPELMGVSLIISLIAVVLFVLRLRHKEKPVAITNMQYNNQQTDVNKATGEITLCSLNYPAGAAGKVIKLLPNANSITVISPTKTSTIPFASISSIEIAPLSNGGVIAYYENVVVSRAGTMDRNERQRTLLIGFKAEDMKFAQMIVEAVSGARNTESVRAESCSKCYASILGIKGNICPYCRASI